MIGVWDEVCTRTARQSGFALLLVLWVLALLAVIAAGIAAATQGEATIARNRVELARARALAEAGVTLALAGLTDPDVNARWRADGAPRTSQYGGGSIAIAVQDEGGKIDLNTAPIEIVAGLFDEIDTMAPEDRAAVLQAIVERRRSGAGQVQAPIIAPPDAPTADMPFASVSELRQLPGMTRPVYDRIRPFVSVYSKKPTVNPMTAPREVLAAVPDMSADAVAFYMAARNAPLTAQSLPPLGVTAAKYLATTDVNTVTITARATTETGAAFAREAVVSLSTVSKAEFLEWRLDAGS